MESALSISLRAAPATVAGAAFQINVRKQKQLTPEEFTRWWLRECRTGGELEEYLRIEKARTTERYRRLARTQHSFRQNNKSDFRRIADIPARDYFRWMATDPDFWRDNSNLRSLRRNNPDVCVYI